MIQLFEKNNMKKYILIIIFIFIHFVSCQQNEIDPKEYFQQVVNIKANQLNADTYKLSSFGRMILFESEKCLIKENYLGESLLDKIIQKTVFYLLPKREKAQMKTSCLV